MKSARKTGFLLLSIVCCLQLQASPLADRISDEVVDSLVETQASLIHSNILSEICSSPNYLYINYASDQIRGQLQAEIAKVAKLRGESQYELQELTELVELEFQAFLDGTNYGALISRNFHGKSIQQGCTKEILQSIATTQNDLVGTGKYLLKKR